MKRNLRYLFTLLFAIVCANTLWAEEVTISLTSAPTITDNSFTQNGVTFTFTKGEGANNTAPQYNSNSSQLRMYAGWSLTITVDNATIESIGYTYTLNKSSKQNIAVSGAKGDNNDGSYSNNTWTGSDNSVTFSTTGTSGNVGFTQIVVNYTTGGGSQTQTPSISANNVDIAYNATSGSIDYTVNNSVTGGVLSATTTADWLTIGTVEETVPFTTTANEAAIARTATVTLTYTYNNDKTVTKDVTVTQAAAPVVYSTIPALFDKATEVGSTATNVNVTFGNWVVSGVSTNGKNVFVTDNNGNGFVIFDTNGGLDESYSAGDILSGTAVACKVLKYNGFAEITGLNASDLTITTGGTVTEANVALADLAGVNTGALVSYQNLTCSVSSNKYYLSDGTTNLQVYNSLHAFDALEDGKTYNITGIYQQYNTTKEILPRSADDIAEVVTVEPSINLSSSSINATAEATDGTIEVTYNNITDVVAEVQFFEADGTTAATYNWIHAEINAANNVEYVIDANDGDARTAYMKVYALDDETNDVYSELVTITQAKYVVDYATLPFSFDGGRADIEDTNGLTQEGLDKDYGKSPYLKFNGANDYVVLKVNEAIGFVAFDITGNGGGSNAWDGTFKVQASEDGNDYTDIATFTYPELGADAKNVRLFDIDSNVRYIKWIYVEKTTGNVGLGNIVVNGVLDNVTVAVAAAGQGLATFASDYRLDFTGLDVEAYIAKQDGEKIALQQVNKVPAGTGVLLRSLGGTEFTVPTTTEDADAVTGNLFVRGEGAAVATEDGSYTNYVLSVNLEGVVGFYWAESKVVANDKAYLHVPAGASAPAAIFFDFETTGIRTLDNLTNDNLTIYDLQGRRVANPTRGLYIVNGKKVVLK